MSTPGLGSAAEEITIVLVDDHALMTSVVADALNSMPDMRVVGVADTCSDGVAAVARHFPDVVLLDQQFPDGLGTDVIPAMLAVKPDLTVLVVSGADGDEVIVKAIAAGAKGVLHKGQRLTALTNAVRSAAGRPSIG